LDVHPIIPRKGTKTYDSDQSTIKEVTVLDLQCAETVCFIPVDSFIAKKLIPTDHILFTNSSGAQILVIAQDCKSAIINGSELAPLKMMHV